MLGFTTICKRLGLTVRSSIDCCIAQLAIEYQLILVYNDRDFETIQKVRSVNCLRFRPDNN
ncbi:PIN domain-containing protein [Tychonema sp. LEGE 06208]|uniref:PIN domain-containing protein n=1 Tax=Tychonema sp. LEGE 06208 TaxID=1828663 RepID=UPI0030D9275A